MVGLCFHQGHPTDSEINLVRLVNGLPDELQPFFDAIFAVGALWAVGVVFGAALIARRWRLARDLAIAGFVGVVPGPPHRRARRRQRQSPREPQRRHPHRRRLAVVPGDTRGGGRRGDRGGVAVPHPPDRAGSARCSSCSWRSARSTWVSRCPTPRSRRWCSAGASAPRCTSCSARPVDARRARRSAPRSRSSASRRTMSSSRAASRRGSTLMLAEDDDGPLHVRVLGRDEADAQFMAKLWRFLLYKDGGPRLLPDPTRRRRARGLHAAARGAKRRARPRGRRHGNRRPRARRSSWIDGRPGPVSPTPTRRTCPTPCSTTSGSRPAACTTANVAHGALNANHVVLAAGAATIVDFSDVEHREPDAAVGGRRRAPREHRRHRRGRPRDRRRDTRDRVGRARRGAAAPPAGRAEPRPARDGAAVPARTSRSVSTRCVPPWSPRRVPRSRTLQQLYRVNTTNLLMAVGTLIAVFALLSQIGDPRSSGTRSPSADWWWLADRAHWSRSSPTSRPRSRSWGACRSRLPLVRTAELQLSMSFSNLAVPAVGGLASQVRFLQLQGIDMASAVAAGGLLADVGNIAAQVILFVIARRALPDRDPHRRHPRRQRHLGGADHRRRRRAGGGAHPRGAPPAQRGDAAGEERGHHDLGGGAIAAAPRCCCSAAT